MKRLFAFILVIVICIFMCSCDPASFSIDRDSLNDVISIDLIEYKNSNQKEFSTWVPNQFDKLIPFVPANATIIETLPSEKISDVVENENISIEHNKQANIATHILCSLMYFPYLI